MVRQRPSAIDRLPELIDAAVRVFAEKGYRGTQMTDIGESMGVAAPSLYNYVDSKRGLFALCLERMMLEGPPPDVTLPFVTPPLDVTLKRIHERALPESRSGFRRSAAGQLENDRLVEPTRSSKQQ